MGTDRDEPFTDVGALLTQMEQAIPKWRIATVDGWLGSGKSCIGREMSRLTPMWAFDLDAFIVQRKEAFLDALALQSLRAAIVTWEARIVITGVCVREVLERIEIQADLHIYTKRMSHNYNYWADEDEVIGNGISIMACHPEVEDSPLHNEVHRYHLNYEPHLNSTFEYQWQD